MVKSSGVSLNFIFKALADPTRRAILQHVRAGEKTVTEVAQPFSLTLAAVSKHLNVLEEARLIARQRRGSFQIVRVQVAALQEAEQWLADYRQFWGIRLDALAQHLEGENK
jgi:DNA-binding transcriptional ArsR family regulator